MLFFIKKPLNFHYLVNIYFTIKKFKKGLKLLHIIIYKCKNFTIKKFKKGLKNPSGLKLC
ncbi:hypothetical protein FZ734_05950 [Campylobacter jejuni]|uniref:Uncharacterized protein n=1 Tax=Campylobacter jejuni TaxID=197 RepID=A0A5Y8W0K4_CAMJU|nr:hypothetical protein [Campylobacter jejuni]ECQ5611660.1 hypothetical protein [Campylobacter jejuni]ECQ5614591.1 hypothetical protein [Campylobacter jejuni]ECQ5877138.1 hypothetical protein [Campylobacter jejuni]ECQ6245181.1 hypothetical protein [Campylobacter jejuni]